MAPGVMKGIPSVSIRLRFFKAGWKSHFLGWLEFRLIAFSISIVWLLAHGLQETYDN